MTLDFSDVFALKKTKHIPKTTIVYESIDYTYQQRKFSLFVWNISPIHGEYLPIFTDYSCYTPISGTPTLLFSEHLYTSYRKYAKKNMKTFYYILTLFLTAATFSLSAQPDQNPNWQRQGLASLNLSQASLSSWSAGGESALGLEALLTYSANYKKEKHLLNNYLELAYGLNRTDGNGTRKTNDKIYLSSTYGYQVAENFYLSGLLTFQTQFAKGYNYDISDQAYISKFMAPGYLTLGAGMTWIPKKWLTVTLSPLAWRGTFVTNDSLSEAGAYGVKKGKHLFSEFGADLKAEARYEFLPNMTVYSRLEFYSNYLDQPQNIDIHWDVMLNMKINNWFSTNLTTNLVYDNDVKIVQKDGSAGPRVQFKEILGVGLQINFR